MGLKNYRLFAFEFCVIMNVAKLISLHVPGFDRKQKQLNERNFSLVRFCIILIAKCALHRATWLVFSLDDHHTEKASSFENAVNSSR